MSALKGNNANTIECDDEGYLHPWDLIRMNDSLRQEVSPFSGDYYKIVSDIDEVSTDLSEICCCGNREEFMTEREIIDGWAVLDMYDHFTCRVKTWQHLVNVGGVIHSQGDHKKTFEIINDDSGISSYSLDRVPAYKLAMQGMAAGTASLMEHQVSTHISHT